MEKLIYSLRNSQNFLLRRIFGFPTQLLEAKSDVQLGIIRSVENDVYGSQGIDAFEQQEPSPIRRAARRSRAQFRCQSAQITDSFVHAAWFVGMWCTLPLLVVYLILRSWRDSQAPIPEEARGHSWVIRLLNVRLRPVWNELFRGTDFYLHSERRIGFGRYEVMFVVRAIAADPQLLKHPKLLVNLLRWISEFGYIARFLRPQTVASCSEGIASSSLITAYLRENGIRHVNLTHGERLTSASSAFFEFDEDHLWGEHFRRVVSQLKPRVGRFVLDGNPNHRRLFSEFRRSQQPRPKRLLIIHNPQLTVDGSGFPLLVDMLSSLDADWQVRMRRHPNWGECFEEYFGALRGQLAVAGARITIEEESYPEVELNDALRASRVVLGCASTALLEAWIGGCKVIYLEGTADRSTVLDRHQGSKNILYAAPQEISSEAVQTFLDSPACLDHVEDEKVNYLSTVF